MFASEAGKLALLWPRDAPKWRAAAARDYRLHRVFEAMAALGIEAEPALYADDVADRVREQLLRCDGVLVWVDPLSEGRDRVVLQSLKITIDALKAERLRIEAALTAAIAGDEAIRAKEALLRSIPGIGPVVASVLTVSSRS